MNMSSDKRTQPGSEHDERPDVEGDDRPIELSEEAAALVQRLEAERDEALGARQRALADYSNFQRRAAESEERALERGAARVVRSLIPVLDNFDLALGQDRRQLTVEQLAAGVQLVREELIKALEAQGVSRIEPKVGAEFDPNRHEAMLHQHAEGFERNTIVTVLQPGYALGAQVLRPAKVSVASGGPEEQD